MPALISITKIRLENLPPAAQGTLGVVRVKFRAGTAAAETIPRQVNPDGSVEWLETLEMVVHDLSKPLVAVVSQENSSGGWSLVPGGRFDGALVTELPSDWYGGSSVATDPTFHAQLSIEMEHGLQRDTRLPPQTGMDKSGGGFRVPLTSGRAAGSPYDAYHFAPGERGGRGGRGVPRMGRAVSGDSSGVVFGGAYGMGAPSASFGYGAVAGGGGGGAAASGASMDLSSSSGASSLGGGGLVTAVAVPADGEAVLPSEAPGLRRASTYSTSSSSTYGPARKSSRKRFPGGWVQSESQDGSFRSSARMSMSDMSSFSESSFATAAEAGAEEPAPPVPADAHLPSPVGTYTPSRLLDPDFQLKEQEEEEGKERTGQVEFFPAYKRPSLTEARAGLGSFGSASPDGGVEEVKTERRPSDGDQGSPAVEAEQRTWFRMRRKRGKSYKESRSSGPSGGTASSESAAGSSETRPFPGRDGSGGSVAMTLSSIAPAAAEEKEEAELARAHRQASTKSKKAGRTTSTLQKTFSLLSRKRPSTSLGAALAAAAADAAAPPPPPSAPPAADAPPTKLIERVESHGVSIASRRPPTAPPSYQEVLRQRGLLPQPPGARTLAGAGAASLYPELAMSRSRSSSLEPSAGAAAAAESPVEARVLPPAPLFATAASFSPSAPVELGSPRSGWGEGEAQRAEASSVDDEAAAALAAVTLAKASQQQQQQQQQQQIERVASGTCADWKDDCIVDTSLQGTTPGAAGAAAPRLPIRPYPGRTPAARPPARPGARPLPAASSETGDDSSESGLLWSGEAAGQEDDSYSSSENLYDTGLALGGLLPPPPSARDRREELTLPGSLPVYSAMPADSLDGSGRVDAAVDRDSITSYPEVRPRQQLEPTESQTTASSEVTDVEPAFSSTRPRQMVPRQLPPESTSASSESTSSTSTSRNMSVPVNTRAVPLMASTDARSNRAPRRGTTSGGGRGDRDGDPVIISCFAPRPVRPGTSFDLQVKAYLRRHREAVLRETLLERAPEAGRPEGMSIVRGKRVTVKLLLPEDKFKVLRLDRAASRSSESDFVWEGEATAARFRVACLPGIDPGLVKCEAMVIEGGQVQRLSFDIEVAGPGYVPMELDSGLSGQVELDTRLKAEEGNVAEIPFDELHFVRELGEGCQGVTSHYRWNGKDVAVKRLTSHSEFFPSTGPTRDGLKHEATILSLLGHHPNVVELYGVSQQGGGGSDEGMHVVTKLEQGGSIEDALGLKRKSNGTNGGGRFAVNGGSNGYGRAHGHGYGSEFDGRTRAAWARDIARGLANSHAADVLHNDIASRNALLSNRSPESRALVCDFGLSKFLREGLQKAHCIDPQVVHERWPLRQMPCESLAPPYSLTAKSDSWMYGIFLYEVFAGERPWAGIDTEEVKRLVLEGKRIPKVPEMLRERGTHMVKLYESCLSKDSEKRPSLEHVVNELSTNYTSMSATW
eukprot:g16050.t1